MERKEGHDEKSLAGWKSMFCLVDSEKTIIENDRKACSRHREGLSLHTGAKKHQPERQET